MFIKIITLLFLFLCVSVRCDDNKIRFIGTNKTLIESPINGESKALSERHGRSWWYDALWKLPFGLTRGLVLIENGVCKASNNLVGVCYTIKQCKRLNGGNPTGFCANKYGRCCVASLSCGGTASNNNTYFINSGFPAAYTGGTRCTLTVQKCISTEYVVCQIRLTFVRFSIAPPVGGVCSDDAITISGGGGNNIRLCGELTGQHLYIDFNNNDNIEITIDTVAGFAFNRYWQILIAQIPCDSPVRAPAGCLQYYYDSTTGVVNSFNFGTSLVDPISTSRQIRNLGYGICVLRQAGYCSITWTPTLATNSFYVSETGGIANLVQSGTTCTDNYVMIPGSPNFRYCGSLFPASVASSATPFVLYYVTTTLVGGGTLGFQLTYTQNVCDNTIVL